MPLSLRKPRAGKTPNYEIRGTYLGVTVERSSGTPKRSVALAELRKLERAIEAGEYPPKATPRAGEGEPTFLSAAIAYMQNGGRRKYVSALIKRFGETPLTAMTQELIDEAANELHPNVTGATRNCYVYTPVSAILHHAMGDKAPTIRRPAGAKGKVKNDFLWPEDAFGIIDQADKIDPDFGLYLLMLLYHGPRKSEMLKLLASNVRPEERAAWIATSKNEDPRMLRLREDIVERIEAHLAKIGDRERFFQFNDGGHFKHLLLRAVMAHVGLPCPKRRPTGWKPPKHRLSFVGFHVFRHTWATWFRMYAGGDVQGLVATGNWRDARSAQRYSHVVARQEWERVDRLPKRSA
jgi:integrase